MVYLFYGLLFCYRNEWGIFIGIDMEVYLRYVKWGEGVGKYI